MYILIAITNKFPSRFATKRLTYPKKKMKKKMKEVLMKL